MNESLKTLLENYSDDDIVTYLRDHINDLAIVPRTPSAPMRRAFHDASYAFDNECEGTMPDSGWDAMISKFERP